MKKKVVIISLAAVLTIAIGSVAVNACGVSSGKTSGGFSKNYSCGGGQFNSKSDVHSNIQINGGGSITSKDGTSNSNTQSNTQRNTNVNVNINGNVQKDFSLNIDYSKSINGKYNLDANGEIDINISGKCISTGTGCIKCNKNESSQGKCKSKVSCTHSSTGGNSQCQTSGGGATQNSVSNTETSAVVTTNAAVLHQSDSQTKTVSTNIDAASTTVVSTTVKSSSDTDKNSLPKAGESNPFIYAIIGLVLISIGGGFLYLKNKPLNKAW